jgi:hypothetical protein
MNVKCWCRSPGKVALILIQMAQIKYDLQTFTKLELNITLSKIYLEKKFIYA